MFNELLVVHSTDSYCIRPGYVLWYEHDGLSCSTIDDIKPECARSQVTSSTTPCVLADISSDPHLCPAPDASRSLLLQLPSGRSACPHFGWVEANDASESVIFGPTISARSSLEWAAMEASRRWRRRIEAGRRHQTSLLCTILCGAWHFQRFGWLRSCDIIRRGAIINVRLAGPTIRVSSYIRVIHKVCTRFAYNIQCVVCVQHDVRCTRWATRTCRTLDGSVWLHILRVRFDRIGLVICSVGSAMRRSIMLYYADVLSGRICMRRAKSQSKEIEDDVIELAGAIRIIKQVYEDVQTLGWCHKLSRHQLSDLNILAGLES